MKKTPKVRTDREYQELDDAIGTFMKWEREIVDALSRMALNESNYHRTLDAARNAHSYDED